MPTEQSAIVIFLPTGHVIMIDNCQPGGYGESLGIITDEKPCACPVGTCNDHWAEYEDFEELPQLPSSAQYCLTCRMTTKQDQCGHCGSMALVPFMGQPL